MCEKDDGPRWSPVVKALLGTVLAILLALLLMTFVEALPALDAVVPPTIKSYVGEDEWFNITLMNTGNDTLFNVTFSELRSTYFPAVHNLSAGTNRTIPVRFSPVLPFSEDYVLSMSFLYLLTEPPEPKTVAVSFSDVSFSQATALLFVGDNLSITNNDQVDATINALNGSFSVEVPAGETVTRTFDELGSSTLFHEVNGFTLRVVVNESEGVGSLAHSNELDITRPVRLESSFKPGELVLINLVSDLNTTYNGEVEGIVEVRNQGTGEVQGIMLEAPWAVFEENDFSLGPGNNKVIKFEITPNITRTNQTARWWTHTILAEGDGDMRANTSYRIYIQEHDFGEITIGNVTYQVIELGPEAAIALCSQNPLYPGCDKLIIEKPIERIITVNKTIGLTEQEILDAKKGLDELDGMLERVENRYTVVTEDLSDIKGDIGKMGADLSAVTETVVTELENIQAKNKQGVITRWVWRGAVFVVAVVLLVFASIRYYAYRKKRFIMFYGDAT